MDWPSLNELNNLLNAIMDSADWLLECADQIFSLGCPDTVEKRDACFELFHYSSEWDEYLETVRNIHLSENDLENFDGLLDLTHEVIVHGISLSAQINDLNWFFRPYYAWEKSEFIQALNPIAQACTSLRYHFYQLKDRYNEVAKDWPQFDYEAQDDEDDELDQQSLFSEPLLEHDGYIRILSAVMFTKCHAHEITYKQSEFLQFLIQQLTCFGEGEIFKEFSFSIDLRMQDELLYLKFSGDGTSVSVSEAGSSYDPYVGSDSYTNWEYTIWQDGQDEGSLELNEDKILEMIQMGATISIDEPDDFLEETQED